MPNADAPDFRKCRNSACGCTVQDEDTYCSADCESHADNAILAGQGCACGHAECTRGKPPAA